MLCVLVMRGSASLPKLCCACGVVVPRQPIRVEKREKETATESAASFAETAATAACNAKVFINAPTLLRNGVLCWQGGPRPKPGPPPVLH